MRILNRQTLTSHGCIEGRKIVTGLLDAGLDILDPYSRVRQLVHRQDGRIILRTEGFEMRGDPHAGPAVYDLDRYDHVYVIGAAKGVQRAALALEEILGDVLTGGHVIAKHGEPVLCRKIGVTLAGHPVPDEACVEGCRKIEAIVRKVTSRDLVFFITGSGVSSLLTYPCEGITLEEAASMTRLLQIEKGAPTSDLNPIRTHIDRFKGGRILRQLRQASVISLTTADPSKQNSPVSRLSYREFMEINTFLPNAANASTYADCIRILKKWDAWERTPPSIQEHLLRGTPEDENLSLEEFESLKVRFFGLLFKDATVYPAVRRKAEELGYNCVMLCEYMQAEAREAGTVNALTALTAERLKEPFRPPAVLMTSGELLVTTGSGAGVGGRNQEYCVAAALQIAGSSRIVFGAVDTDGTDGPGGLRFPGAPSCLAGAVTDGYTLQEARQAGIDLWEALKTHSTSEPLWKLGCGVSATSGVSALDLGIILLL